MTTYKDCQRAVEAHKQRLVGADLHRPLTELESQIVYGLYSFATFAGEFGKGIMEKRNKAIPRSNARLGLIRWACKSLFDDYMAQLAPEARTTFERRAHNMMMKVSVRTVAERYDDGWKLCPDKTLESLARAAWTGQCQYCALKGVDARKCKLRKAFDGLQCLEPTDSKDCWYKPVD